MTECLQNVSFFIPIAIYVIYIHIYLWFFFWEHSKRFWVHFSPLWFRRNPLSGQGLFYRLIVQSLRGLYILHSRLFPLFSLDARKPLLFDLSWSIDFVFLFRLKPTMVACRCAQPCFAALQILFYFIPFLFPPNKAWLLWGFLFSFLHMILWLTRPRGRALVSYSHNFNIIWHLITTNNARGSIITPFEGSDPCWWNTPNWFQTTSGLGAWNNWWSMSISLLQKRNSVDWTCFPWKRAKTWRKHDQIIKANILVWVSGGRRGVRWTRAAGLGAARHCAMG